MNGDIYWAIGIGTIVLVYAIYIFRGAIPAQIEHNRRAKRYKELAENHVRFGPSKDELVYISKLLSQNDQQYTPEQLDELAFKEDNTWVMYAYPKNQQDPVQGVMIAKKNGPRLDIEAFAVDDTLQPAARQKVAERIVNGLVWEGVHSGADELPTFRLADEASREQLRPLFDHAYVAYQKTDSFKQ